MSVFLDGDELMDVVVLGKNIGKATGWDMQDTFSLTFYDFDPNELGRSFIQTPEDVSYPLDLGIDFNNGRVDTYLEDGVERRLSVNWSVFNV